MSRKKYDIKLNISPECIKVACVELITKGGIALSVLDNSGFRKIITPIYNALPEYDIIPNSHNIKVEMKKLSEIFKEKVKKM